MDNLLDKLRTLNIGAKLSAIAFVLISLVLGIGIWTISETMASLLEKRSLDELQAKNKAVVDMIDVFNADLKREASRSITVFEGYYPGKFTLDPGVAINVAGKSTPALKNGGAAVNLDHSIPDRFTARSKIAATVFVKTGKDLLRVATSLKNDKGDRAFGTILEHGHPAYAQLMAGEQYNGPATLFNRKYFTQYIPIRESGQVIGALFIGIDFTEDVKAIKDRIKTLKIGDSGYFYALDASDGKQLGDLVVHPTREGANILMDKSADSREYIKEILSKKNGEIQYASLDDTTASGRARIAAFSHFKDWNWVIVGGTYTDEITGAVTRMRNGLVIGGFVAIVLLAGMLYLVMRRSLSRPLGEATQFARQLAGGDLTVRIETKRKDEVGQLLHAMNNISQGLTNVVSGVRNGAETIAAASREIATGNQDLSSRTEQQASSLQETASSMEQVTSTIRQNADNAKQANQLAVVASNVAAKGGDVVSKVVERMGAINQSSQKIADIIGVIDGIAFQTNILALNAAVEAARAGEQGKGFAVVASEVRALAQRSATAAREIKELIEESVITVADGGKLVEDAGATMTEVVTSIKRVHDLMNEIAMANMEQSEGIEQINRAIVQMDQVTQQNAALVEEAAASAEAMRIQTDEMVKRVGIFKLAAA